MNLRHIISLTIISVFILLSSCETDVDVTAKYKEVAIVYGLLNQNDSVHYLRINKAFLGEGNALTYARIADSSNYGSNIDVRITETTPTGISREIVFDTTTLYRKDSGAFYSPGQLLYSAKAPLNQLNTYTLKVKNKNTSYEVSSATKLVNDFAFTEPSAGSRSISFKRAITQPKNIKWANAVNGKRYQLTIHFYFKEARAAGDTTLRSVDWVFPSVASTKSDGTGSSEVSYLNEDFFKLCEKQIPYGDATRESQVRARVAAYCDLDITVIGEDFNTYLDVNGPTTSVVMDKPVYSNIQNGIGLFSCRYQLHRIIALNAETRFDLSNMSLKFQKPQ